MSRRTKLLAFGLAAAAVSAAAYVFLVAQNAINETPKDERRIVAVVDSADVAARVLKSPNAVVIAVKGLNLKSGVQQQDQHRVLETETEHGWLDLAKHLRPQILAVLPEQLSLAKAENPAYVGSVVLLSELSPSS